MPASSVTPSAAASPDSTAPSAGRTLALLLGLHGLAFAAVFPLGPQAARLWHPGVAGFAALTCAFPFAAVLGGLLARRARVLPSSPRTLALLAAAGALPVLLTRGFEDFLLARALGGLVTGVSFAAIHRVLAPDAFALVARLAPRVVAFGLPVFLFVATAIDWRAGFAPLFVFALWLAARAPRPAPPAVSLALAEADPAGLVATGALGFVSAAYLTVMSGFLVFNAGHTEWHTVAALTLACALGLNVPRVLARLRRHLPPGAVFLASLAASALSLVGLLALQNPVPAAVALGLIAFFLAANASRHAALAGLVLPPLAEAERPTHQFHTHLAHHFGAGLGAVCTGLVVKLGPDHHLVRMPALLACALAATGLAALAPFAVALKARRRRPAPPPQNAVCASPRP